MINEGVEAGQEKGALHRNYLFWLKCATGLVVLVTCVVIWYLMKLFFQCLDETFTRQVSIVTILWNIPDYIAFLRRGPAPVRNPTPPVPLAPVQISAESQTACGFLALKALKYLIWYLILKGLAMATQEMIHLYI